MTSLDSANQSTARGSAGMVPLVNYCVNHVTGQLRSTRVNPCHPDIGGNPSVTAGLDVSHCRDSCGKLG